MAAPPGMTTKTMSGKFTLNQLLSDDPDEILCLQGATWPVRRAMAQFGITLCVKHTTDKAGVEHFDMDQLIYSIPAMGENRPMDAIEREESHFIFGSMMSKSRRLALEEITDDYLKQGWTADTIEHGHVLTECWSTPEKNTYTWRNAQMWGFATVNGKRYYVARVTCTSPLKEDGPFQGRFVFDYVGPLAVARARAF